MNKRIMTSRPSAIAGLCLLASASLWAASAQAQTLTQTSPQTQAQMPKLTWAEAREVANLCRNDVRTHCRTVKRGDGRIAACLKANSDKVSAPCKAKIAEILGQ